MWRITLLGTTFERWENSKQTIFFRIQFVDQGVTAIKIKRDVVSALQATRLYVTAIQFTLWIQDHKIFLWGQRTDVGVSEEEKRA